MRAPVGAASATLLSPLSGVLAREAALAVAPPPTISAPSVTAAPLNPSPRKKPRRLWRGRGMDATRRSVDKRGTSPLCALPDRPWRCPLLSTAGEHGFTGGPCSLYWSLQASNTDLV